MSGALLVKFQDGSAITPTGLRLQRGFTFEDWERAGQQLGRLRRGLQWAVGDWVNLGEARFGEKAAQAIDATGLELSYIENLAYVAGRFAPDRRSKALPWSFHQAVASLEPKKADKWLATAEAKKWGREEFREALKEAGVIKSRGAGSTAQGELALEGEKADEGWFNLTLKQAGADADVLDRATRRAMEKYGVRRRVEVVARWAREWLAREGE